MMRVNTREIDIWQCFYLLFSGLLDIGAFIAQFYVCDEFWGI